MAKKPSQDMEVQQIKDHLGRQDKTLQEILFILGGSSAMGVTGMRQDVKDLKIDVDKLKKSDSMRGKWLINLNSIPGAIITIIMIVGSVLGIIKTFQDVTKAPPTSKPQIEQRTQ
jgi:hypothetical protein